jgi:hypothetical protein
VAGEATDLEAAQAAADEASEASVPVASAGRGRSGAGPMMRPVAKSTASSVPTRGWASGGGGGFGLMARRSDAAAQL